MCFTFPALCANLVVLKALGLIGMCLWLPSVAPWGFPGTEPGEALALAGVAHPSQQQQQKKVCKLAQLQR